MDTKGVTSNPFKATVSRILRSANNFTAEVTPMLPLPKEKPSKSQVQASSAPTRHNLCTLHYCHPYTRRLIETTIIIDHAGK
jgi:hypothetical protein